MKIVTIVGARPQFVKAAAFSRAITLHNKKSRDKIEEYIIHTGQHYDENMSEIFFKEMQIPKPYKNLEVGSLTHGKQTGIMLEKIEKELIKIKPDYLLIYGDTNSTLAGALAAIKLHIKIAHIEAGLRSFNRKMPEEINRILSDTISNILFCPTNEAILNLKKEGIKTNVFNVGDIMFECSMFYKKEAEKKEYLLNDLKLEKKNYILSTIHRAENTDDLERLTAIFSALNEISKNIKIVLPLHPRTKNILKNKNIKISNNILIIEPVSYLEMVFLEKYAKIIMTDSGGVQKEAFFFEVPCITLRDQTEWVELVKDKKNLIVGANKDKILEAFSLFSNKKLKFTKKLYGNGNTSELIINKLLELK